MEYTTVACVYIFVRFKTFHNTGVQLLLKNMVLISFQLFD